MDDEVRKQQEGLLLTFGEITAELKELEKKDDPASRERFNDLLEQLLTVDMALGPMKRAMGGAAASKDTDKKA